MVLLSDIKIRQFARLAGVGFLCFAMMVSIAGCGNSNRAAKTKIADDAEGLQKDEFDTNLTFNAVTLEDVDKQGRLLWKVKAKQATYSRDRKIAKITEPSGELYQDGKAVIKVSAQGGEVLQDGQRILLRGKIVATDIRDGLVLNGNELEWRPKEDIIFVRNNMTGTRKNWKASAKNGQYLTRKRRLELTGQVAAEAKDPNYRLSTERMIWLVEQQKLMSDRPLQMQRYQGTTITDRATANQGEMNIKTESVSLNQNAQLNLVDPAIQVNGNQILWQIKDRKLQSNQPITIVSPKDNFTLSGNQGNLDLNSKLFNLNGNVNGVGGPNQAVLKSDRLSWQLDTQDFEANGNVTYRQAKPPMNLAGPKAKGRLKDQQVVVSGGRVVTEFYPSPAARR
jgi:LPS export ABC transporter protein LptC